MDPTLTAGPESPSSRGKKQNMKGGETKELCSHISLSFFAGKAAGEGHRSEPSCAGSLRRNLPQNPCCRPHSSSSSSSRLEQDSKTIPAALEPLKVTVRAHLCPVPPPGHPSAPLGNVLSPAAGASRGQRLRQGSPATGTLTPAWEREGQPRAVLADECGIAGLGCRVPSLSWWLQGDASTES